MKLTLLGTSCMVPTKERNVSGSYLFFKGEGLLFDCGEGTQRQMQLAGLARTSVRRIFISHWHADHVAGILGLIQTIGNKETHPSIDIYGPKETQERMKKLLEITYFDKNITITVHENDAQKLTTILQTEDYTVQSLNLEHAIPCLGFRFVEKDRRRMLTKKLDELGIEHGPHLQKLQQGESIIHKGKKVQVDDVTYSVKGKVFTYIPDTAYCPQAVELAKDADVVLAESTYADEHEENAHAYHHMTSRHAAQIAQLANAKRLILTHISQRYKDPSILVEQAKDVFSNVELGFDLMPIKF